LASSASLLRPACAPASTLSSFKHTPPAPHTAPCSTLLASSSSPHLHRRLISDSSIRLRKPARSHGAWSNCLLSPVRVLTRPPHPQDFLTRDLTAPPSRLAQPSAPAHPTAAGPSPASPTRSTSAASPSHATASTAQADRRTSDAASLTPSSATGSTLEHNAVVEQTAARFATLRTADPAPAPSSSSGVPGEPAVEPPTVAKGDWLAYGRVKAQVVLWPEGTVGVKGGKKLREREGDEEWVVEGTLWVTKVRAPSSRRRPRAFRLSQADQHLLGRSQLGEIVLVINQTKPPVHVDRSRARMASLGRRLSIGSFGRTTSRDSGGAGGTDSTAATDDDAHAAGDGTKGGFTGFVKKVVSAVTPGKSSSSSSAAAHGEVGSGDGMSLTRTRTGERTPRTTPAGGGAAAATTTPPRWQSGDESAAGRGGLTFEEPEKAPSPFPTYKVRFVSLVVLVSLALVRRS